VNPPTNSESVLYPLAHFYGAHGHPLPEIATIDPSNIPPPYHDLLVHHGEMTSRLEAFHQAKIILQPLQILPSDDFYRREVLLCQADSGLPVEYGAIEIHLAEFSPALRQEILDAKVPLGGLLNQHGIIYRSEPRAFLTLAPDRKMTDHFQIASPATLYGRSNCLLSKDHHILAKIVEILRP
jgi:chorismate-pyruvate lyase